MWSFFILALLGMARRSSSSDCPAEYERYSSAHTACISRNPGCDIKRSGVSPQEVPEILRLHNQYRSDLALGKETRAIGGTLPEAADMLQMVWDDELAGIAQKWAENCEFSHDCNECRAVANFGVGQNLAMQVASCPICKEEELTAPQWVASVKAWYEEVLDLHKDWLEKFDSPRGPHVEHFTQVAWAKTWRVGCGYAAYKVENAYNQLYVCNYGPAGNVLAQSVYKEGEPCSACPTNTCCGSSCTSGPNYPGLCKMLNSNTAPVYQRNLNNLLFFCDSNPKTKDCEVQITGTDKWVIKESLQGNYMSIELNEGESSTLGFNSEIVPSQDEFCVRFHLRKGPSRAAEKDASSLQAAYKAGESVMSMDFDLSGNQFADFAVDLQWKAKTTFSLTFSVPKGAAPHILDLKEIMAFDGKCDSRQD